MREPENLPFLARPGYRKRRLIELMRLLPVAGLLLFMLPLLWATGGPEAEARTSSGMVYLFLVWLLLIVGTVLVSKAHGRASESEHGQEEQGAE